MNNRISHTYNDSGGWCVPIHNIAFFALAYYVFETGTLRFLTIDFNISKITLWNCFPYSHLDTLTFHRLLVKSCLENCLYTIQKKPNRAHECDESTSMQLEFIAALRQTREITNHTQPKTEETPATSLHQCNILSATSTMCSRALPLHSRASAMCSRALPLHGRTSLSPLCRPRWRGTSLDLNTVHVGALMQEPGGGAPHEHDAVRRVGEQDPSPRADTCPPVCYERNPFNLRNRSEPNRARCVMTQA
jgi:hypothetical protein